MLPEDGMLPEVGPDDPDEPDWSKDEYTPRTEPWFRFHIGKIVKLFNEHKIIPAANYVMNLALRVKSDQEWEEKKDWFLNEFPKRVEADIKKYRQRKKSTKKRKSRRK